MFEHDLCFGSTKCLLYHNIILGVLCDRGRTHITHIVRDKCQCQHQIRCNKMQQEIRQGIHAYRMHAKDRKDPQFIAEQIDKEHRYPESRHRDPQGTDPVDQFVQPFVFVRTGHQAQHD